MTRTNTCNLIFSGHRTRHKLNTEHRMNDCHIILFLLVAALLELRAVSAVSCYTCSNAAGLGPPCTNPFNEATAIKTECVVNNGDVCGVVTLKGAVFARGCAQTYSIPQSEYLPVCLAGSHNGNSISTCYCTTENCNSAPPSNVVNTAFIVTSSALVMFITLLVGRSF